MREAGRLLGQQTFHLLIADLDYLRSMQQSDWLSRIRRNSFVPVIILSDTPEEDINSMVQLGADMCISGKWPCSLIADLAYAQLRRYTEYNHYSDTSGVEVSAFRTGDIFRDCFKFCVNSKTDIRFVDSYKWAEPDFQVLPLPVLYRTFSVCQ